MDTILFWKLICGGLAFMGLCLAMWVNHLHDQLRQKEREAEAWQRGWAKAEGKRINQEDLMLEGIRKETEETKRLIALVDAQLSEGVK